MGPIGWSINTEDDFEIDGYGQIKPIMGLHLYELIVSYFYNKIASQIRYK